MTGIVVHVCHGCRDNARKSLICDRLIGVPERVRLVLDVRDDLFHERQIRMPVLNERTPMNAANARLLRQPATLAR